jgi:hypothetical protein
MAVQRRKTGSPVWETNIQRTTRRLGIIALVIGAALGAYGLIALNNTLVSCPAFGCSSAVLWRIYGAYDVSLYGGVCLAVIGATLVLVATFKGAKPEKWRTQMVVPAKV